MAIVNKNEHIQKDDWIIVVTDNLPENMLLPTLSLSELITTESKPNVLLPIDALLSEEGLIVETLKLLKNKIGNIGVWLSTHHSTQQLDQLLKLSAKEDTIIHNLKMILIDVPAFVDGRGFSLSEHLRLQDYAGEIRLSGNFGVDQLVYLSRSGADTYVVADDQVTDDYFTAFGFLETAYAGKSADNLPMFR